MKAYDYMHSGLTDGLSATPGNQYEVLRGPVAGRWLATKQVQKYAEGKARLFVNEQGDVAYFGEAVTLR